MTVRRNENEADRSFKDQHMRSDNDNVAQVRVVSTKEAARITGYAPKTLANWRVLGWGPRWLQDRAKGKVRYPIDELENWQASQLRTSTSDRERGND